MMSMFAMHPRHSHDPKNQEGNDSWLRQPLFAAEALLARKAAPKTIRSLVADFSNLWTHNAWKSYFRRHCHHATQCRHKDLLD